MNPLRVILRKSRSACRRIYEEYQKYKRRRPLKNRDFSIISNNCWSGLISKYYGLPYNSPTCGILILGDDYIKFCKNLKFYLSLKLQFIKFENSIFSNYPKPFPVAKLNDIQIGFMHYKTEKDAEEKWYRRAKRINWDNLIVKISHRKDFNEEQIKIFSELDFSNKLIFAEKDFGTTSIIIPGISCMDGNETPLTLEKFNLTDYLNSIKNDKRKNSIGSQKG